MLRVSDEIHRQFKKYIANRLIELDEIVTVNSALKQLLMLGEANIELQKGLRGAGFVFTPFEVQEKIRAERQARATKHLKDLKLEEEK